VAFGDQSEPAEGFGVSGGDEELTGGVRDEPSGSAGDVLDDADGAAVRGVSSGDVDPDVGFAGGPAAGFEE
jgi:hypothetical protein